MIPSGMVFDQIVDILNASAEPDMKTRIWLAINYELTEIARKVSLADLRCSSPANLDFSASTVAGLWLPSDIIGIDAVWDDTDDVEFFEKDRSVAQLDEWGYRYYRYLPSRAHLFSGTDLILQKGGSSFTSAALTADGQVVDGEYVMFDDEPGFYEISSDTTPFTFTPTYYGEGKTQKYFKIRPWETTKRMVIIDPDEDLLYDRDVDVYYWRVPAPVYRKQDMLPLPSTEYLKLRVLRSIPQAKGYFPVSERMLSAAFKDLVGANPRFSRIAAPVDKHNAHFDFDESPFTTR